MTISQNGRDTANDRAVHVSVVEPVADRHGRLTLDRGVHQNSGRGRPG